MGSVEERKVPTATLNYGTGRDIHNNGVHNLIKDFKFLLHEGNKNGDVTFLLKAEKTVKAHLLIVKARYDTEQMIPNICSFVILLVCSNFLDANRTKEKPTLMMCLLKCSKPSSNMCTLERYEF